MMNYVQSSYTELNDCYQMRIFDWVSASALGRREPELHIGKTRSTRHEGRTADIRRVQDRSPSRGRNCCSRHSSADGLNGKLPNRCTSHGTIVIIYPSI